MKAGIRYGKQQILKSINLEINTGEIYVLMGPSGSGKTTLLRGIAGLVPFSEGEITWGNVKRKTGLVFQEPRLFPHMTVLENLAFGLRAKGVSAGERKKQVKEFLGILQLDGLEDRYPHQLSGGQQQRVSLGRVLMLKPDLLLLDEPFASLDAPLRVQLTEWLYGLQKRQGFSIIWITHYMDEAFSVADRVGLLMEGEILQEGEPLDFYHNPSSEKVAAFFSLTNRFSVEQWKKWLTGVSLDVKVKDKFSCDDPFETASVMGWLPANAISLVPSESVQGLSSSSNKAAFVWIEGEVKRVKHETKAKTILLESHGECLEVELNLWEEAPHVGSVVKVGIPLDKMVWYSR